MEHHRRQTRKPITDTDESSPFSTDDETETFSVASSSGQSHTDSNSTITGISVCEPYRRTCEINPHARKNAVLHAKIKHLADKYKIRKSMADRLLKLRDFEIVIVIDDSGSMKTTVDGTEITRWQELCELIKIVIEIAVIFDTNGVDIYFINGRTFEKVKDPHVVDEAFMVPPSGYTPLVPVLDKIFQSPLAQYGRDKKLLVFVATDGIPTDDDGEPVVDELEHSMCETRNTSTTHVSFLLCTDDPHCVEYLSKWDKMMQNMDVTDDFKTEKANVHRCHGDNIPFTYGDYVVKALIGAIDPEIDNLNEPP